MRDVVDPALVNFKCGPKSDAVQEAIRKKMMESIPKQFRVKTKGEKAAAEFKDERAIFNSLVHNYPRYFIESKYAPTFRNTLKENGPCTAREIVEITGMKYRTVAVMVASFRDRGYLRTVKHSTDSLRGPNYHEFVEDGNA